MAIPYANDDTVQRRISVGLKCVCGWGMWQTEHETVVCKNKGCEYAGIEYECPTVTLRHSLRDESKRV